MKAEHKKLLLKLARDSINTYFESEEPDTKTVEKIHEFMEKKGCFVTLHKNRELRGCIGYVEGIFPLYKTVAEAARAAAFQDPRFTAVKKDELKNIEIEISVLSVPELIKIKNSDEYLKEIKTGKDGLIIRGWGSGLLLPQVATEWNFNVKEFLECLCNKAGMNKDAWKDLNNKIYKFQADVFHE